MYQKNGADQLCGYRATDLHLCFPYAKGRFSLDPVCFFLVWLLYEQYGF